MPDSLIDPASLEGDALTRWYLRSPAEIERERQAAAARRYQTFFYRTAEGDPDPQEVDPDSELSRISMAPGSMPPARSFARPALVPLASAGRGQTASRPQSDGMIAYGAWWKNDPNGPAELSEALRIHAPSFFERRRSLEDQARLFGRAEPRWKPGGTASRIYLALTLYRMGELEEACAALRNPPRTVPASWLAEAESVRRWIGCESAADP